MNTTSIVSSFTICLDIKRKKNYDNKELMHALIAKGYLRTYCSSREERVLKFFHVNPHLSSTFGFNHKSSMLISKQLPCLQSCGIKLREKT